MSEICAGIVTYHPDILRLEDNLRSVTEQVYKVYVVDNHSSNIDEIRKLVSSVANAELLENGHNNGIAAALNQLCGRAEEDGCSWILTLDQDTVIPVDMIETFKPYTIVPEIGIICPEVYYEGCGYQLANREGTQNVYACMTSAALTRIEAWYKVGGFREDYFIDFVDNEFCMKLTLNQYRILRVNACQISHQLGESGIKKILGLKVRYSKHSPLRIYYMARNNYEFIKEYSMHLSVFKEKVKMGYVLMQGILFSDNKKEAIKYARRGIRDAKKGITGKFRA